MDFSLESFDLGPTNQPICDKCTYRWLIANFKELGQYSDANECYYIYRKSIRPDIDDWRGVNISILVDIFVDRFLDFTCGYGVRPLQPIKSGGIIVLLFGAIFCLLSETETLLIDLLAFLAYIIKHPIQPIAFFSFTRYLNKIYLFIKKIPTSLKAIFKYVEYSLRIFTFQSHELRLSSGYIFKFFELVEGVLGLIIFGLFITTLSNMMAF